MDRRVEIIVGLVLLPVIIYACSSIKENRMECPCLLTIDMDYNKYKKTGPVYLWVFDANSGDYLWRDTICSFRQSLEIRVKRTSRLQISALCGLSGQTVLHDDLSLNSSFVKRDKFPSDTLYFCSNITSSLGESAAYTLRLHKDHAKADIYLNGKCQGPALYPQLYFSSLGRYIDGRYVAGKGCISMGASKEVINGEMLYSTIINRQENIGDLRLSVYTDIWMKSYLIKDFPLGKYLLECGYNPQNADMEDIEVHLDISLPSIALRIGSWEKTVNAEIEL